MNKNFYIYGAGTVATSIYTAIKTLYNLKPIAFCVSEKEGNPVQIDGIPVKALSEMEADTTDRSALFFIAVPEVHHGAIADSLYRYGIPKEQLIFVDNKSENSMMERYYSGLVDFVTVNELLEKENVGKTAKSQDVKVFQAKCHVDKPLKNRISVPEYVCPIQVGAALTDQVIVAVRDNCGENISGKNRNYCELTASYFAWKNCNSAHKGLCHYRRIFDLTDEQMKMLFAQREDVDVILPYPSIHYPDINGQHKRYVSDGDWDAMLQAMQKVAPEYYKSLDAVLGEQYFYNFNMLIAKREVFDDYCDFLFSVLERTEELTTPKGWERADRFAGYLGENLTTIYFRKNKDRLKIVHAGKLWLV